MQQAKRTRVTRACDQCRSSREKCDGVHPKCNSCTFQNRDCTYNEQPKKRGIQPHYLRTLELTLAWILTTSPAVEARLGHSLALENNAARDLIRGRDAAASEVLLRSWRDGFVNKQLDQLLSGAPVDSPPINATLAMNQAETRSLAAPSQDSTIRASESESGLMNRASRATYTPQNIVRLPENFWQLLEFYFAFTHSWIPMSEKHSLIKLIYTYPRTGLDRNQLESSQHAELWSILALAAAQMTNNAHDVEVLRLRDIALDLLPKGDPAYEIAHIKAMINLTLLRMQNNEMLPAWLLIGTVTRVLCLFKLMTNPDGSTKWCRHIDLVAFVIERAIASQLHTFGHLSDDYIRNVDYVDEDGLDEWTPWTDPLLPPGLDRLNRIPVMAFSTLNRLVRAHLHHPVGILEDIAGSAGSIVLVLLQNAARKDGRSQPSILVTSFLNEHQSPGRNPTMLADAQANPGRESIFVMQEQRGPHPFSQNPRMTVPPNFPTVNTSPVNQPWTPEVLHTYMPCPPDTKSTIDGNELFEQLAMLERVDSNQNSQFMHNLGFAPDSDLADFFGADYEPSDPSLTFLQPRLSQQIHGAGTLPDPGVS